MSQIRFAHMTCASSPGLNHDEDIVHEVGDEVHEVVKRTKLNYKFNGSTVHFYNGSHCNHSEP